MLSHVKEVRRVAERADECYQEAPLVYSETDDEMDNIVEVHRNDVVDCTWPGDLS